MSKWKKLLKWTGIISVPALCTYAIFGAVVIPLVVFETGASKEYNSVAKERAISHWADNFDPTGSFNLESQYHWNESPTQFKVDGRDSKIYELTDGSWSNINPNSDKLVIFSHGLNSTHWNAMETAFYWARMGYRVISWDQRGSGENRDKHITFGYSEADDLNNLYNTVIDHPTLKGSVKKIIMYGQSNGAATTLSFADRYQTTVNDAFYNHGIETKFIEESGYTSPKRQFETALNLHGILPAAVVPLTIPMYEVYADRNLSDKDADYLAQSDNIKQPLFIAHGDADPIVDFQMGVDLYSKMKANGQSPSIYIGKGLKHIGVSRDSKINESSKTWNAVDALFKRLGAINTATDADKNEAVQAWNDFKIDPAVIANKWKFDDTSLVGYPVAVRFFYDVFMWDTFGTITEDLGGHNV